MVGNQGTIHLEIQVEDKGSAVIRKFGDQIQKVVQNGQQSFNLLGTDFEGVSRKLENTNPSLGDWAVLPQSSTTTGVVSESGGIFPATTYPSGSYTPAFFSGDFQEVNAGIPSDIEPFLADMDQLEGNITKVSDASVRMWDQYGQDLMTAHQSTRGFNATLDNFSETVNRRFAGDLTDSILDVVKGTESAERAMQNFFSNLGQWILETILKYEILNAVQSMGANTGSASIIGAIFGGARASGGPVESGIPYLVGEKGPELFVPDSNGDIVPNRNLSQAPVSTTPIYITNVVLKDPDEFRNALANHKNQDAIVNVIGSRSGEVRRIMTRK